MLDNSINYFPYWSDIDVAHGCWVDGDTWDAEKISSTHSLQVGWVKETFTQLVLLDGEVDVVTIGELIEGGGDTGAVLNPENGNRDNTLLLRVPIFMVI